MQIERFSPKQLFAARWWKNKKYRSRDAIICDGSVRSGKTFAMSVGFALWASSSFEGASFAFCGKTITSLRRNLVEPLLSTLREHGFTCAEKVSANYVDISFLGRSNRFYYFGGKDEGSAAFIQGMTLAGVFFDEVALIPRSFVEQALARCSVRGSKFWFNCNPDSPAHWFYTEWIKKADEKNAIRVRFTMDDNPSLSPKVRERYERLYTGAFYDRFVLGKWTPSEGAVYPMFSEKDHVYSGEAECSRYVVSCDYGTVNPSSFGLWGLGTDGIWRRVAEYYYSSKREGAPRTDEEHYAALEELTAGKEISEVIIDPSAASFIECVRRHGRFRVVKADNDVVSGIRLVGSLLKQKKLLFHESCKDIIREFRLYRWNEKSVSDAPVKENDHAMDDMRYFAAETFRRNTDEGFFAMSVAR